MKLFNFLNWFNAQENEGVSLDIEKSDISKMKNSDNALEAKVQEDLKHKTETADRRVVMMYEKNFRDKFRKMGNLNQKCPYCAKEYKSLTLGEKKCIECKNTFLVQKRVQDMNTVAFKSEQKEEFETQWRALSNIKRFKHYLGSEFDYIKQHLEKQGKRNLKDNDIMQALLGAYAKNSLSAGHYRLYTAFLFHKAELMRSEQDFAEALTHYFYIHFLVSNGVTNTAEFKINLEMNAQIKESIQDLLDMGSFQMKKLRDLYTYAITHHNRFNEKSLAINIEKSYKILLKEFKDSDEKKEDIPAMRSFVLYSKKAS